MRNIGYILFALFLLPVVAMAVTLTAGEIVHTGTNMTVLYHMDLTASGTDSGPKNNTLKKQATVVTSTNSKFNGALDLGSQAGYMSSTVSSGIASNATFTLGCWFYTTSTTAGISACGFGSYSNTRGAASIQLNTTDAGGTNIGAVNVPGGGSNAGIWVQTSTVAFATGTWVNVIVSHQGSTQINATKIYVNGVSTATSSNASTNTYNFVNYKVAVGTLLTSPNGDSAANRMIGLIDEMFIDTSTNWSSQMVAKYYNQAKGRFNPIEQYEI